MLKSSYEFVIIMDSKNKNPLFFINMIYTGIKIVWVDIKKNGVKSENDFIRFFQAPMHLYLGWVEIHRFFLNEN